MKSLLKPFVIYAVLDIFCTGMGMGVPFMNIQLGFLVGWYLARRGLSEGELSPFLKLLTTLSAALVTLTVPSLQHPPSVFSTNKEKEN